MYCKYCGNQFESYESGYGEFNYTHCQNCDPLKKYVVIFCVSCGKSLQPIEKIGPKGKHYLWWGSKKYCDECKKNKKSNNNQINSILVHRKVTRQWQLSYPERVKASVKARLHPELLNVLYECPCNSHDKHNHRFDYHKPFEVIRLCPNCHSKEHIRLRKLQEQP